MRISRIFYVLCFSICILLIHACVGYRISKKSNSYFRDLKGIYYCPNNNIIEIGKEYVEGVDKKTFIVMNELIAKDKNNIYVKGIRINGIDYKSFYISKTGLIKDKSHIFVEDNNMNFIIANPQIDTKTAEYVIRNVSDNWDEAWIKDQYSIFFNTEKTMIDPNSFHSIYSGEWLYDNKYIYTTYWDSDKNKELLSVIDSAKSPIYQIENTYYLRNGFDILYRANIVYKGHNNVRIKAVSQNICYINGHLYKDGKLYK